MKKVIGSILLLLAVAAVLGISAGAFSEQAMKNLSEPAAVMPEEVTTSIETDVTEQVVPEKPTQTTEPTMSTMEESATYEADVSETMAEQAAPEMTPETEKIIEETETITPPTSQEELEEQITGITQSPEETIPMPVQRQESEGEATTAPVSAEKKMMKCICEVDMQ